MLKQVQHDGEGSLSLTPTKAEVHLCCHEEQLSSEKTWIPACAGMTVGFG